MKVDHFNCLSVGVGGQGVVLSTQILAHAALLEGYQVRCAETHGMAQRGGSISGYLRFGAFVEGPLIPAGDADIILSFELAESIRYSQFASSKTHFFISTNQIIPSTVYQDRKEKYPSLEEIYDNINSITKHVYFVDTNKIASDLGDIRIANVIMLGILMESGTVPLRSESVEQAILKFVPKKTQELNQKAFHTGIERANIFLEEFV